MRITGQHALWQADFTVAADIANGDARDLQTDPSTSLDDIGLTLDQLDESGADIATAKKANTHDGG
jgi:hypothetical protein